MKKKKPNKGYILLTVCAVVDELLWILDPEDARILFKNIDLKTWLIIWIVLEVISLILNVFYLIKLKKSQNGKILFI